MNDDFFEDELSYWDDSDQIRWEIELRRSANETITD